MAKAKARAPRARPRTSTREAFFAACLAMPKAKQARWASGREITNRTSFRIDDSNYREFAAWVDDGAQPGAHLRYADAKRLGDPQFERSTLFRGAKHNWMHVTGTVDAATLRELIETSYRAAGQRGGGLANAANAANAVYAPLRRGLEQARPVDRPARVHAGGPAPKIASNEGPAAFKLALWSAREVHDLVPAAERAELARGMTALDKADALRDRLLAELPDREIRMGRGYEQLSTTAAKLPTLKGSSEPIVAARGAIDAFRSLPGGYNDSAVAACTATVQATVTALAAAGRDVAAYLAEFDRRVLIAEVQAVAKQRSLALSEPRRVLWRGADDKGYPAYWVVELAEDELGLVCKIGRRWRLTTGNRAEVLATIPDSHFEIAVDFIGPA